MTMRFMDGFDVNDVSADITLKWDNVAGTVTFPTGVYGKGKALTGSVNQTKTLALNIVTGMVGFHYNPGNGVIIATQIVVLQDAGSDQIDLRSDATGALFFTRNGTTIGSVSTFRMNANQWYWFELQATIDPSVGVANLYVNGTSVLAQSGLNTRSTSNSFFNQIRILVSASQQQIFDSLHCWDTAAGDVTAFPYGEHVIDTSLANAAGTNAAWTRGGTNTGANYSQVNESNQDGDTTYVTPTASNQIDSYNFTNLVESGGTIGVVAINTISRIDDAPATHQYEHYVLSSGSAATSAAITPGASYLNAQTFQGTDPNTGSAWTVAGVNAAEFGYEDLS